MAIIDVSLQFSPGMHVFPGNPPFQLDGVTRIARGDPANVSRMKLGTHTGTHVDAPLHFFDGRPGVEALSLDLLIGPCTVVEAQPTAGRGLTAEDLERSGVAERLLLKTSNSRLWQLPSFTPDFVYLTPDAAEWIRAAGVKVVGIDYLSIERFQQPGAPAHRALLGGGVIIIEGLDLAAVPPGHYELICLPLRVADADGAPARVVLRA